MEALDLKDSEDALFKLGGDYDRSKEPHWKTVGKYDHSNTRKGGEEVIQAARNLVNLEQVIKGAEKVGRNYKGGDLE